MLSFPRTTAYFQALRFLPKVYRSVCSSRSQLVSSDSTANVEPPKNSGYGEKEICLLQPIDSRTPLPGNTGLAPTSMLFKVSKSHQKAKKPLTTSQQVFPSTLEDRQRSVLTNLACSAVESILCSPLTLECVAHECPELLRKDFMELFPRLSFLKERLTIMTLCQKTEEDMSQWSEKAEQERSWLEDTFIVAAQAICAALQESGYFADFIHPSTGKPFSNASVANATMFETDIRYTHFGFAIEDLGCCKVISHHLWGTHAFVGAIFTNATINSPEIKAIMSTGILKV